MQYIDKTIPELKKKAHDILKMFIDGQWQDDAQSYINLTYTDFDNKLMLSRLLLKEARRIFSTMPGPCAIRSEQL